MTNCKEFFLEDLMAVTAIPLANIPASSPSSQANVLAPTIPSFNPSLTGAVTIGRQAAAEGVVIVPIRPLTGKAKDDEGDSVSGRLHTVSVTCEVDERGGEIWSAPASLGNVPCSLCLEREPHHLLLTFRDGTKGFVAATQDSYQCNVERDGAKTTVAFRIQCLMGIQLIV